MVPVYTLTSVLSAFLVFLIQPVAAKLALPTLGGTPVVWNGCMLFFQTMLLLGYLYAHGLSRWVQPRQQPVAHLLLLFVTVSLLPIQFHFANGADPVHEPISWLLTLLFYSLALPFFTISATSPLLQRWFAYSDHPNAHNPYFLYAASNVGSMGALLAYPFLIEPFWRLQQQVDAWQAGIVALAALFLPVGYYLRRIPRTTAQANTPAAAPAPAISWRNRLHWVALSFVPASLLYSVTAYITTDIASAPLLWLLPLTLYLITFIAVFAVRPRGIDLMLELHLPVSLVLFMLVMLNVSQHPPLMILHLLGGFVLIWAMHGLLARNKPAAQHLTEYFLCMSVGGVLGGAFNTLAAPYLFDSIAEYWITLLLGILLRYESFSMAKADIWQRRRTLLWLCLLAACVVAVSSIGGRLYEGESLTIKSIYVVGVALAIYALYIRLRSNYALVAAALMLIFVANFFVMHHLVPQSTLMRERSVFGVYSVQETKDLRIFMHGTTVHGSQLKDPDRRLTPLTYYMPLQEVFAILPPALTQHPMALVGLGAGTSACYVKPDQRIDIYELDAMVETIARDTRYFTYMRDCPGDKRVILGDARLNLQQQANAQYGLLIMDAFSSDSIPTHLLTEEAVRMYRDKITDEGALVFHVSNRYLELRYVLGAISHKLALHGAYRQFEGDPEDFTYSSIWVVLTPNEALLKTLTDSQWRSFPSAIPDNQLWTDDFSNLLFTFHFMRPLLGLPPLP
jgi:spermidine synthase